MDDLGDFEIDSQDTFENDLKSVHEIQPQNPKGLLQVFESNEDSDSDEDVENVHLNSMILTNLSKTASGTTQVGYSNLHPDAKRSKPFNGSTQDDTVLLSAPHYTNYINSTNNCPLVVCNLPSVPVRSTLSEDVYKWVTTIASDSIIKQLSASGPPFATHQGSVSLLDELPSFWLTVEADMEVLVDRFPHLSGWLVSSQPSVIHATVSSVLTPLIQSLTMFDIYTQHACAAAIVANRLMVRVRIVSWPFPPQIPKFDYSNISSLNKTTSFFAFVTSVSPPLPLLWSVKDESIESQYQLVQVIPCVFDQDRNSATHFRKSARTLTIVLQDELVGCCIPHSFVSVYGYCSWTSDLPCLIDISRASPSEREMIVEALNIVCTSYEAVIATDEEPLVSDELLAPLEASNGFFHAQLDMWTQSLQLASSFACHLIPPSALLKTRLCVLLCLVSAQSGLIVAESRAVVESVTNLTDFNLQVHPLNLAVFNTHNEPLLTKLMHYATTLHPRYQLCHALDKSVAACVNGADGIVCIDLLRPFKPSDIPYLDRILRGAEAGVANDLCQCILLHSTGGDVSSILPRFDLVCSYTPLSDTQQDTLTAAFILDMPHTHEEAEAKASHSDFLAGDKLETMLLTRIESARMMTVTVSSHAQDLLNRYFLACRAVGKISVTGLGGAMKIAVNHARLHLRSEAVLTDALVAVALTEETMAARLLETQRRLKNKHFDPHLIVSNLRFKACADDLFNIEARYTQNTPELRFKTFYSELLAFIHDAEQSAPMGVLDDHENMFA